MKLITTLLIIGSLISATLVPVVSALLYPHWRNEANQPAIGITWVISTVLLMFALVFIAFALDAGQRHNEFDPKD